jgi:transposase
MSTYRSSLSEDEKLRIRRLKRDGKTAKEIGIIIGRPASTISDWALSIGAPFDNTRGRRPSVSTGPMSEERKEAIRQGLLRKRDES